MVQRIEKKNLSSIRERAGLKKQEYERAKEGYLFTYTTTLRVVGFLALHPPGFNMQSQGAKKGIEWKPFVHIYPTPRH